MKRLKALVSCCVVAALMTVGLVGCSSQEDYTPPEKNPSLTTPTIGQDGELRVGFNADNAPFSVKSDVSDNVVGIDVDVAAALADSLGLKLRVVDVGSDPEGALSDNRVDIVMGARKSDTETTFWKSDPYIPTGVALFASSSEASVPTESSTPSIAAQVSSTSSWIVTNEFGDASLVPTNDLVSAFESLESGEVQYVAADAIIGTYASRKMEGGAPIVALMQQPSGYSVGVLDSNNDLKQAISEAVAALTGNGIMSAIEQKWLGKTLDLSAVPLTSGAQAAGTGDDTEDDGTVVEEGDEGASASAPADAEY